MLIVVGSATCMLCLILISLISFFFQDDNPNSRVPWALSGIKIELLKICKPAASAIIICSTLVDKSSLAAVLILLLIDCLIIYYQIFCIPYCFYIIQISETISSSFTMFYSIYLTLSFVIYILL